MAQTQYAINGHTTKPTRRSAIAIDTMMRLEGEDLSFFKGSFQTDQTTNKFPKTIIADMTIAGMEKAIDMVGEFPTFSHPLPKSLSLVILEISVLPLIAAIFSQDLYLRIPIYPRSTFSFYFD